MRFHVLRVEVGSEAETEYEPVGTVLRGEAPRCPVCSRYVGMLPWLPPYRARIRIYGKQLGDVAFGSAHELLLSDAFVDAWRTAGLTGMPPLEPVEISKVTPKSKAVVGRRYFHCAIGRPGPRIDPELSRFVGRVRECDFCLEGPGTIDAILSLRIDEQSWGGEDIFVPWGSARLIVTETVVELASVFKLANVTTTPIEEFRWDPLRRFPLEVSE